MSTSSRVEVLLWAQRVIAKKHAAPHELLEIKADASVDAAQDAFHKLARIAHPDLHRTTLDAAELETVTTAYAYAAAAYQAIRVAQLRGGAPKPETSEKPSPEGPRVKRHSEPATGNVIRLPGGGVVRGGGAGSAGAMRSKPITASAPTTATTAASPAPPPRAAAKSPTTPPPIAAVGDGPAINPSTAMNSKALIYYRKAEMALRQGDLRSAVLNLKMAIASDPASTFLRQALVEVEAEMKAGK